MRIQVHPADVGGCGHYRLIWAAEALGYAGADIDLVVPDTPQAAINCLPNISASAAAGRPVLGRLRDAPDYDVLVLQRPLTHQLVEVIRLHQAAGVAVVVEIDDDFETIDPANIAWRTVNPALSPDRNWHHLREAARIADLVTVTTPALAHRYGRHGRVVIIPNHVPSKYLHVLTDPHDGIRVGWSGSIDTHPHDLQVTRGAVGRLLAEHGLTFHLIGSGRVKAYDAAGTEVEITDVRILDNLGIRAGETFAHTGGWLPLVNYAPAMAELDVGIVPLAAGAFNEGKSWLKGLELASVGVPFVATPTGPYRDLVALGAGVLADRPRTWYSSLDRLITDDDYRYELGQAGRRVANSWLIENNLEKWLDAWTVARRNADRRRPSPAKPSPNIPRFIPPWPVSATFTAKAP